MVKPKTFILQFIILAFILILLANREIKVLYKNSIPNISLKTKLFLDDRLVDNKAITSTSIAMPFETDASLGFHTIRIECPELNITESVKVFTLFQNNIKFKFAGSQKDGFNVTSIDSWFTIKD